MEIKYFGLVAEHIGAQMETIDVSDSVCTVAELRQFLESKYEGLGKLSYQVSRNRKLVASGELNQGDEIALLPPFSGG
jgi:molybdopterin converting factor small subunit